MDARMQAELKAAADSLKDALEYRDTLAKNGIVDPDERAKMATLTLVRLARKLLWATEDALAGEG